MNRFFTRAALGLFVLAPTIALAQARDDGTTTSPVNQLGQNDRPEVPPSSSFTGPASNRALPPPAPLPDLHDPTVPDPLGSDIEQQLELVHANEVVQIGKREQRLADIPMTVSWIPASELDGVGALTLCDAIQFFPGMECRRGPMRKAAISSHGLGSNFLSNRLLLLKDGRPLTDPWTGIFYPDETTPLSNVKQLEVIRGPGSSLYGSNAFAGVINIVQRTPDDLIAEGRNIGADLRVLGGAYTTYRVEGTVAAKAGPVSGEITGYKYNTRGAALLNNPTLGILDKQEWADVNQGVAKVIAGPITVDAEYTDATIGRPGGVEITTIGNCGRCHYRPNDTERMQNFSASAQVEQKLGDHFRVFGNVYTLFKRREVQLEDDLSGRFNTLLGKRNRVGGELRGLLTVGPANVTIGGDVKSDFINNRNVLPGTTDENGTMHQTIIGAFADAEVRPIERLALGAGVRIDQHTLPEAVWANPSAQLSPRASVVFRPINEISLRANYGRAFRAPTPAELAINQQMYASTLIGNPELKAETLDTVEAAVDAWPFGGLVRLTGTGFYKRAHNLINQEYLFGSVSQFQNIGDARVAGFEADAAAQVKQISTAFDLGYQFLDARRLAYDGTVIGRLDYAATHRLTFRAHTNVTQNVFTDAYLLMVSWRQDPGRLPTDDGSLGPHVVIPGYMVASARVGVNIVPGLSASLIGQNIFNQQYQESFGFPMPGASLFGEVRYVY